MVNETAESELSASATSARDVSAETQIDWEDGPAVVRTAGASLKEATTDVAALASSMALLDETRRRFEATERRFDDMRNRGRGLAAAVAALLALDVGLLSTFSDPTKDAPVVSAVLAGLAIGTHALLLRALLRLGYGFEPSRGLPNARKIVNYERERGQLATIRELIHQYAKSTHELDLAHKKNSAEMVHLIEHLINSVLFPVLAALVYASRLFSR